MTADNVHVLPNMSDAEKRDAARRDLATDPNLTGAAVAARYKMSPGWGQKQMRAVRDATSVTLATETVTPAVTLDEPPMPRHAPVPAPVERSVPPAETPRAAAGEWVHRLTLAGVLIVAGTAAVISYEHMRHLAMAAGEGWRAWFVPLSVDGLMVTASMTALTRRRDGRPVGWLAWTSLLLGVAASVAANIAAADPTLVDPKVVQRIVAAWPPIALGLSFELLLQQGRDQ